VSRVPDKLHPGGCIGLLCTVSRTYRRSTVCTGCNDMSAGHPYLWCGPQFKIHNVVMSEVSNDLQAQVSTVFTYKAPDYRLKQWS
jgi:hypothetical protein